MKQLIFIAMKDHTFGHRIHEARQKKRLSQKALADLCGITRSAVSQWETDRIINISGPHLEAAARVLGVSVAWLLYGTREHAGVAEPPPDYTTPPSNPLAQVWGSLTKAQREEITASAKAMAEANAAVLEELRDRK